MLLDAVRRVPGVPGRRLTAAARRLRAVPILVNSTLTDPLLRSVWSYGLPRRGLPNQTEGAANAPADEACRRCASAISCAT